jgi:hypothetical protein
MFVYKYCMVFSLNMPVKLISPIKMCLNKTYSKVHVGKNLSNKFLTQNGLKQRDALSPLYIIFSLECTMMKAQESQDGFEVNGAHQPQVYADDVNVCVRACVRLSAQRLVGSSYSTGTRYVRMHTHTHMHMPMHSTPHTTTARHTQPGIKWSRVASSFSPP